MTRHDHPEMLRLRVYDWSDGSFVDLLRDGYGTWLFEFSFVSRRRTARTLLRLTIVVHDPPQPAGVSYNMMQQPISGAALSEFLDRCRTQVLDIAMPDAAKKLRGFLRDAGVGRRLPAAHDLVWRSGGWEPALCEEPFFVPDDRWAGRYEEAQKFVEPVEGEARSLSFLDLVSDFSLNYVGFWAARGGFFASRFSRQESGSTLEKAVDNFLRERLVFPESERAAWEAEHVEHGTWVCPSAEEVELYRLLGEVLPLFWVSERLEPWAAERVDGRWAMGDGSGP